MSVVISHARDVLQGLAGTCLCSGTPVTIGGVFSRRLQGPEESDKHLHRSDQKTLLFASKYIHNN